VRRGLGGGGIFTTDEAAGARGDALNTWGGGDPSWGFGGTGGALSHRGGGTLKPSPGKVNARMRQGCGIINRYSKDDEKRVS